MTKSLSEGLKNEKALKYDAQKARTDLLSTLAMEEIAKVLAYGAKKYAADNWRLGMSWRRLLGAAIRHIFAFLRGEDYDSETGLSHLAHAGCCIMFLLEYQCTGNGTDDRWNESNKMPCSQRSYEVSESGERAKEGGV